ncbi:GGDEF domain-containing protein [Actinoplanes subtropicus]|uniref:substrate-binding and GGDEF domain-containing protein n=1 Tax=Actinoplanes subtropicus TaxID=543632 RepID=UPI0004C41BEF|nr:GGDEF domain-containing protein [Actinoplanes subtropicus]
MRDAGAIGVLSPFVGGTYYGSLVAGVGAAARSHGRRLIAIQTLDAAAELTVHGGDPGFDAAVSWDHIAGFVALADAVRPEYLARLAQAGKPVVLVGHTIDRLELPAVLPDNTAGMRAVVTHLIRDHGCRRIAFTGHVAATDIRERYEAYAEVLRAHGLEPGVFLPAVNNVESGVTWDARELLRYGRPDALVAATDRNAFTALRVLAAAGLRCPDDILVTGFDNIDEASLHRPELATVRQPLEAMSHRAVDLLIGRLEGTDRPGRYLLPTRFVPRSSCGCTTFAERLPDLVEPDGVRRLGRRLAEVLPAAEADAAERGVQAAEHAATATADALLAAAAGDPAGIGDAANELQNLLAASPTLETLRVISRAVQEYADDLPAAEAPAIARLGHGVQAIMLALGRSHSRVQLADHLHLRSLISINYTLSMAMLHRRDVEPRDPSWLGLTPATAGSIALRGPDGELVRTPGWRRHPGPPIPAGPTAIASFPPVELLDAAAPGETVFVVRAKVGDSDRGWLALVDVVENRVDDGRELVNQCAALLTVALDLRDQEERLRREARSDRLTGLPNRSAFLSTLENRLAYDGPAVVLFLDLDGFKHVNDTLGHHTGDHLLVGVADRLRDCLRAGDVAARYGGDEFLVLLDDLAPGPELDEAVSRIHDAICAPYVLGERVVRIGVSIGSAPCVPGSTAQHLLQEADLSMYDVKAARRTAA